MTEKEKKDSGPAIKVEYKSEDKIGIVSINRPSKMNAISFEMFGEFEKAIETLLADPTKEVRALILTGEGQHFSSGLDLLSAMKIGSLN